MPRARSLDSYRALFRRSSYAGSAMIVAYFFQLLLHTPALPHGDHNGVELFYSGIPRLPSRSPSKASLSRSSGSSPGPNSLSGLTCSRWFPLPERSKGNSSRGVHGGHSLSSSTTFGSSAGDVVLSEYLIRCHPPIANEPKAKTQSALCFLDV